MHFLQHYVKQGPKAGSFTTLTTAHDLILEWHQLRGSLSDPKIWKKKALGTQSCGFGKSQLFLNISTDRLSPVGAERNILACSSAVRPLGIRASLPGSSKEVVFYAELWRWKAAELPNGFSCFTWGEECHGDRKWSLWVDRHKVLCSPACSSGRCLGTALDHSLLNFFFNVQWCLEMEMGTYEWEIHKYSHPSIYLNDIRK